MYDARWMLDGRAVTAEGVGYNKQNEVVRFELSDKVYSTKTVTWQIKTTNSRAVEGAELNCQAQYSTGMSSIVTELTSIVSEHRKIIEIRRSLPRFEDSRVHKILLIALTLYRTIYHQKRKKFNMFRKFNKIKFQELSWEINNGSSIHRRVL